MWQRGARIPVAWGSLGGLSGRGRLESGLSIRNCFSYLTCYPQNRTTRWGVRKWEFVLEATCQTPGQEASCLLSE